VPLSGLNEDVGAVSNYSLIKQFAPPAVQQQQLGINLLHVSDDLVHGVSAKSSPCSLLHDGGIGKCFHVIPDMAR
jgi:hypothetical protein